MNVFAGLNDAGKSNVLKALNLFFNNETESDVEFDFEIDYSKYAPIKKHKAKEIIITITFEIPERYSYNEDVVWKKVWRSAGLHYDGSNDWEFPPYSKVSTLLKRIKYKYVPAVKSDNYFKSLLADLYMSIAKEADSELVSKAEEYSSALDHFTNSIGLDVQKIVGINSNLIMPPNQVDIFKELIFLTKDLSGKSIDLAHRGDGIRAIHIPAILKYIAVHDNKLMFNTAPITTIWGYEEPENGIELKKCFELANELMEYSHDAQIFITTHSPAFYQLGNNENSRINYIYKGDDFSSQISNKNDVFDLHEKIGLMPIIAPVVAEKQSELDRMKEIIHEAKFIDKDSIYVEGITDKEYLELAISCYSPILTNKLRDGSLQIVTRTDRGCGTGLLVEWATVWMHCNFVSKALFLFDSDKEGKNAKRIINEKANEHTGRSFVLKTELLSPTEDIKHINSKIHNSINYCIEQLLSYGFWKIIIEKGWAVKTEYTDLYEEFKEIIDSSKSLDNIIDLYIDNTSMKDTIISYLPAPDRKVQIKNLVKQEVEKGNTSIIEGLENTIRVLEKEFG